MIPLMSLVIGSAPLLGVAFLMGGVTVPEVVAAICCLSFATLQITIVSICASALMKTGTAAFWLTYGVLITMYFGPVLMAEAGVLSFLSPSNLPNNWMFLFPPYQFSAISVRCAV